MHDSELVLVKGGNFLMGDIWDDGSYGIHYITGKTVNDRRDRLSEKPVHEVKLGDFYLAKKPITVNEFRQFIDETGYSTQAETGPIQGCWIYEYYGEDYGDIEKETNWDNPRFDLSISDSDSIFCRQQANSPVVCVSWYDCIEYCNWLSTKNGLIPCYVTKRVLHYPGSSASNAYYEPHFVLQVKALTLTKADPVMLKIIDPPDAQLFLRIG